MSGDSRAAARFEWLRERGMGATALVAAISTAFGVLLVTATTFIGAWLREDPLIGDSASLTVVVGILGFLLLGVAVYVAAIVTANTFATIVAGRIRRIALLRLIGASARAQRRELARQGLIVGGLGAFAGLLAGIAIGAVLIWAAGVAWALTPEFALLQPALLLPAAAVVLTTWAGAWAGARRVLTVTPMQALAGSTPRSHDEVRATRGRRAVAITLLFSGVALLGGGVVVGMVTPLGVIIAFFGGILSFTGLALGAVVLIPPLLGMTGRLFGRSAEARLAAQNALRYPERSSRMTIGVVMGVTLVVMFAVASETVKAVMTASAGGDLTAEMTQIMDTFAAVMMGLVAVSAVIAAVGLVNLLTIGIVQRRREFGLLRALGLTSTQVRRVVLLEASHITVTALAFGLVLGGAYGWVAAQSLLGSVPVPPLFWSPTLVPPALPWGPLSLVVVLTAILTAIAAVVPTRVATRVTAVEALAE